MHEDERQRIERGNSNLSEAVLTLVVIVPIIGLVAWIIWGL